MTDPSVAAREQYLTAMRRIERLAQVLADAGHEPTDEMRIAYKALRGGVLDEAFELERPLILASYLNTLVQPEQGVSA
jgi:hypothetical protein